MSAIQLTNLPSVQILTDNDFVASRAACLEMASSVIGVTDEFTQGIAVDVSRDITKLRNEIELGRKSIKSPVLELGRKIDAKAEELESPLRLEQSRINKLVANYQAAETAKREAAERARQAEIRRIEAEQRAAAEAERKAKQDAEEAFTKADQKAAEQAAKAEQDRLSKLQAEAAKARTEIVSAPVKAAGLVIKKVTKFEVLNLDQVLKHRPDLCKFEISTSAVNEALRRGERNIPGLRIWEETKAEVRS